MVLSPRQDILASGKCHLPMFQGKLLAGANKGERSSIHIQGEEAQDICKLCHRDWLCSPFSCYQQEGLRNVN